MSQTGSVRKRKDKDPVVAVKPKDAPRDADLQQLDAIIKADTAKIQSGTEWDFRIALSIITFLAFLTRFWGISHPNEVVFDEVHFGKVFITSHNLEALAALISFL